MLFSLEMLTKRVVVTLSNRKAISFLKLDILVIEE